MKYFYALCITLCTFWNVNSQKAYEKEIKVIDSLLDLSWYETTTVDMQKSLVYALDAVFLSEEINHSESKAWSYFFTGQALTGLGSYKKAIEYLSLSERERYTATNPQLLAEIYRVRGRVYGYMGFNDRSIREFKQGITHINKLQDESKINYYTSLIYENLCYYYERSGHLDSVFYYANKNKEILKNVEEPYVYGSWLNLYNLMGELYSRQQKYDSAVYYFNRAIAVSEEHSYLYTSKVYTNWGRMEAKRGSLDLALSHYYKALNSLKTTGLKNELPFVYRGIADIYQAKEAPDSVEHYKKATIAVENELSRERLNAAELALEIILSKEAEKNRKKLTRMLFQAGSVIVLIIMTSVFFYATQQKKKNKELSKKEEESKELKQRINTSFQEVTEMAKKNDPLFLTRFREVYPEFIENLLSKHSDLNNSDLALCAMLYLNFSSKDISQYTFIEHRSVQTKKNRLRRKLKLSSGSDLYHYFKTGIQA